MKHYWIAALFVLLSACGGSEEEEPRAEARPVGTMVSETGKSTIKGAVGVVAEPFEDIGIKRTPIPEKLTELVKNPYIEPPAPICLHIAEELEELEKLLGPDVDAKTAKQQKAYRDEGADIAEDQALSILRGKVQILPFRGVVRKISGADRHARKVIRAYEAGKLRRAFLKGLALANRCE